MKQSHGGIQIPDEREIAEFGGSPRPEDDPSADAPPPAADSASSATADDHARQLEEYKDKYLRAKAEVQNVIKRSANERAEALRYANVDLARSMLNVLGDLDRTLDAGAKVPDVRALLEGVALVRENYLKALAQHDIHPIKTSGEAFDPRVHQAVMQRASAEHPAGTILEELERGYTLHDRVLRPAKVIVAAALTDE